MTLIYFQQDTCRITLCLDKLPDLPLRNVRKLFAIMLSEQENNADAIEATTPFLDGVVAESKESWAQASKDFHSGWRLVRNKKSRRPEVLEILRENRRLTTAVRATKANHERWLKLQTIWNDTKHTMN